MQPKVKIALSIFTFVALVLTGLAAAEQVPKSQPKGNDIILSPSIISLSPKLVRKKNQFEMDEKTKRNLDSLTMQNQPAK